MTRNPFRIVSFPKVRKRIRKRTLIHITVPCALLARFSQMAVAQVTITISPTSTTVARGLAYLKMGQGNEAAHEFQKILALHNFAPTDLLMSMAHLGLGRAYALSGDTVKSRTAHQDFFALWKDADPDIPAKNHSKTDRCSWRSRVRTT